MNRNPIPCRLSVAFVALLHLLASLVSSRAEVTHELVASFDLVPHDLGDGSLTLGPDGYFWGTSTSGGKDNLGMIYKVKADGSDWTALSPFSSSSGHQRGMISKLVDDGKGHFWGVSERGGSY